MSILHDDVLEALKDLADHLKGGAPVYPGSLIFREDKPAVDVIQSLVDRIASTRHVYRPNGMSICRWCENSKDHELHIKADPEPARMWDRNSAEGRYR